MTKNLVSRIINSCVDSNSTLKNNFIINLMCAFDCAKKSQTLRKLKKLERMNSNASN
jgi:hypothetical protein